ncbi:MAG: hypothetical protein IPH35_18575 [Rhodoferax sp.]|nr:hypothetical protein [Rhodoferax sp.]
MTLWANVAITLLAAVILTVQVPVPLHAPPQPAKLLPAAGVAASVTLVPLANAALHVLPQLMPAGALVTVPVPVPLLLTDKTTEPVEPPPSA